MATALAVLSLTLGACGAPSAARPARAETLVTPLGGRPVGPGETIDFTLTYLGVEAGRGQVRLGAADGGWSLRSHREANLAGLYSAQVDEEDELRVPGAATSSDQASTENGAVTRERYDFDADAGRVWVHKTPASGPPIDRDFDLAPGAHVALTAVWALRAQPLALGESRALPVFTGKDTRVLVATALERTTLETAFGTLAVMRVGLAGQLSDTITTQRDTQLYLTDDDTRLPVRMQAVLFPGVATLDAVGYRAE